MVAIGEANAAAMTESAVWNFDSWLASRGGCQRHAKSTKTPTTFVPSGCRRKRSSAVSVAPSGSGCAKVLHACVTKQIRRSDVRSAAAA
jgi:hypothetical protein